RQSGWASPGERHGLVRGSCWRGCPVSTPTSRLPSCLLHSALLPASYSPGSSWGSRAVVGSIARRLRALRGGAPRVAFCCPGSSSSARPFEGGLVGRVPDVRPAPRHGERGL